MQKIFYWFLVCTFITVNISAQTNKVTISGIIKSSADKGPLSYANVAVKKLPDSSFVTGTIATEDGHFSIADLNDGEYLLQVSYAGYQTTFKNFLAGKLSRFLDLGVIELSLEENRLNEVVIAGKHDDGLGSRMDKKSYSITDNISQGGGSVLQAMKNLPGITTDQDGKVQLRGSDKVAVLVDGKQTALTGFGNESGLDNIPASAIERIEIINNPSAKYDANGNAGIINIIYKKNKQEGFNGKVGMTGGLGALWVKKENYPGIRPQYTATPKVNPSLSLNYRKNKINAFFQGDWLYTKTLNKNEFSDRVYDDGTIVHQQVKRNRTTNIGTGKLGLDWNPNENNMFTVSGLFSSEKILDRGDIPYFNNDFSVRNRLWQFLEDELKTTVTATAAYQHKFKQPGHVLNFSFNYTFHRENEKYFFDNIMPTFTGMDTFKLISDEQVGDFMLDYARPLKHGRLEAGLKFRRRYIPTDMLFLPGLNSPLDVNAGGWANYAETIPAAYGNYVYEAKKFELEAGLRVEYVNVEYKVNPNHNTYTSDGYNYTQPFPNVRLAYKLNDNNKVSLFFNRRVDRPNEVDIRIFPKYDDAEIIKVGNPTLQPQFTNSAELGYKTGWEKGYLYAAAYHRMTNGTITRIATIVPGSTLIYNVYQNAGKSSNTGLELVLQQDVAKWFSFNTNINLYRNIIDSFTVENKYPVPSVFSAAEQRFTSGNVKLNNIFHLPGKTDVQLTAIYLAPDIIPQGKIDARFYIDLGAKKQVQKGKGELFLNASDLLNTLRIRKEYTGVGFSYNSTDYYETQVIRLGYSYKF